MIRLGLRLTLRGGREAVDPAGRHRRRGRARRRPAADRPWPASTRSTRRTPGTPGWRPAPAGRRTADAGRRRPAVVAAAAPTSSTGRLIGRVDVAATGPARRSRPGIAALPGPGEYYASPALATLLRTTPAAQLGDRYPGHAGRHHRRGGAAGAELADHRHRPHRRRAVRTSPGAEQVTSISTTTPSSCNGDVLSASASTPTASTLDPGRRRRGAAVPGADLHRRGHPAVGRPARAALRRDAPGRRHPAADLGDLDRRVDRRRRRRRRRRLRRCSSRSARCWPRSRSPAPRSSSATCRSTWLDVAARRARHPARRGGRGPARAAPGHHLAARRDPAGHAAAAARLAADPAARRARRAGLLRRRTARPPTTPTARSLRLPVRHPADDGRAGHRRAVADHARLAADGRGAPTGPATLIAGRRLADNPAGGFRADQRAGARACSSAASRSRSSPRSTPTRPARATTAAGRATLVSGLHRLLDADADGTAGRRARRRCSPTCMRFPASGRAYLVRAVSFTDLVSRRAESPAPISPALPRSAPARPVPPPSRLEPEVAGSRFSPRSGRRRELTTAQLAALPVQTVAVVTDGSAPAIERARTVLIDELPSPRARASRRRRSPSRTRTAATSGSTRSTGSSPTSSSSPACRSPAARSRSASSPGSTTASGRSACCG